MAARLGNALLEASQVQVLIARPTRPHATAVVDVERQSDAIAEQRRAAFARCQLARRAPARAREVAAHHDWVLVGVATTLDCDPRDDTVAAGLETQGGLG